MEAHLPGIEFKGREADENLIEKARSKAQSHN